MMMMGSTGEKKKRREAAQGGLGVTRSVVTIKKAILVGYVQEKKRCADSNE
jgi:hypothetical protein